MTKRLRGGKTPAQTPTRLSDAEARADAIGRAAPFTAWPRDVQLLRLAAACSASSHASEASLIVKGERCDHISVVAEGTVLDVQALPSLAAQGADAMFPPRGRPAPQQPVERPPALLKGASGGAAGGGARRRRN
jgi:hypothetical protein